MSHPFLELLDAQRPFFGPALLLGSTRVAEAVAQAGYDFAMVDCQHGDFHKQSMTDAVHALLRSPTAPLVRVADNQPGLINDALDAGALGVVVPMVETPEQAAAAVRAALYPPDGARSKGPWPGVIHGSKYYDAIGRRVQVVVMIETPEAVARADAILATPGVSLCLVGTSDLSFCMGCARTAPQFRQALQRVLEAGARHKVPIGAAVPDAELARTWLELGFRFFLSPHDLALLQTVTKQSAASLHEACGRAQAVS